MTGAVCYGWTCFCAAFPVNEICRSAVGMAIPLLLTGGFHVDGFMDTMEDVYKRQVQEGNAWCTTNDLYQQSLSIGYLIGDIHAMLMGEGEEGMSYLFHLE